MKTLLRNKNGNVQMIGVAVATLVAIFIAVLVVYNIAGSIETSDVDADLRTDLADLVGDVETNMRYAGNATVDTLDQSATFFTIAPLIVVVMVAVIILGYVITIGGKRGY